MSTPLGYIRHGIGAVRPYLYGNLEVLEFIKQAFGGVELERLPVGSSGFHVESRIGDSVVVIEAAKTPPPSFTPGSIYIYVPDADAAYERAVAAGAVTIAKPEDKPYQERAFGVRDPFGNIWYVATYRKGT
jgi:PhnB protein